MGLVAFGASDAVSLAIVPKRFTLIGNMFEKYWWDCKKRSKTTPKQSIVSTHGKKYLKNCLWKKWWTV
jgi:hypothetical protein